MKNGKRVTHMPLRIFEKPRSVLFLKVASWRISSTRHNMIITLRNEIY